MASYKPFPVALLPEALAAFTAETAAALGCEPAFVAVPALAATAAAIGTTRAVELKKSWPEYAILWAAVVARSGTLKSPAFDAATAPLRHIQANALREHADALEHYERAALEYERDLIAWRRNGGGEPPEKPKAPAARRFIVSDTTVEALAPILQANPRGVLAACDELAKWVRSFDAYKARGRGGDAAAWLELWRAGMVLVDRKSGGTIHIPRAAASVCGTIQPGTLAAVMTPEYWESGLTARLLLVQPPAQLKRWTDRTPARRTLDAYEQLIGKLLLLDHADGEHGPEPVRLPLASDARQEWEEWYNQHARRIHEAESDRQAAALAKLEAYAARFALVFALATNPSADCVSAEALAHGVALANWFAAEAERVYGLMAESDEDRELRHLADLVREMGGTTTARELMRHCRALPTAKHAEAALNRLVQAGLGQWRHDDHGGGPGCPVQRLVLVGPVDADTIRPKPNKNGDCVNVNAVNTADADPLNSDEWVC